MRPGLWIKVHMLNSLCVLLKLELGLIIITSKSVIHLKRYICRQTFHTGTYTAAAIMAWKNQAHKTSYEQ